MRLWCTRLCFLPIIFLWISCATNLTLKMAPQEIHVDHDKKIDVAIQLNILKSQIQGGLSPLRGNRSSVVLTDAIADIAERIAVSSFTKVRRVIDSSKIDPDVDAILTPRVVSTRLQDQFMKEFTASISLEMTLTDLRGNVIYRNVARATRTGPSPFAWETYVEKVKEAANQILVEIADTSISRLTSSALASEFRKNQIIADVSAGTTLSAKEDDSPGERVATILGYEAQLNGKPMDPGSYRHAGIREGINAFLNKIRDANVFENVLPYGISSKSGRATYFSMQIAETEDKHLEKNVPLAMAVGFFTLGMAPTMSMYTYKSSMRVNASRWGGVQKSYHAESEVTTETWGDTRTKDFSDRYGKAATDARTNATNQNIEKIVSQILADGEFFQKDVLNKNE
jgi:hypothetical protein